MAEVRRRWKERGDLAIYSAERGENESGAGIRGALQATRLVVAVPEQLPDL